MSFGVREAFRFGWVFAIFCPLSGILHADSGSAPAKRFDPLLVEDHEILGAKLLKYVVRIHGVSMNEGDVALSGAPDREGLGVAISPRRIATLSHLFSGLSSVDVVGPKGTRRAILLAEHRKFRVAIFECENALSAIGIEPPVFSPRKSLRPEAPVFALMDPEGPDIVTGFVTHSGKDEGLSDHVRTTFRLVGGTPIFDDRARLVGIMRTVPADPDPQIVIPHWIIASVRTASTAHERAVAPSPAPPTDGEARPWWAK